MTEFSKTFLVFYKWPNLTNYQGVLRGTVNSLSPSCDFCRRFGNRDFHIPF